MMDVGEDAFKLYLFMFNSLHELTTYGSTIGTSYYKMGNFGLWRGL